MGVFGDLLGSFKGKKKKNDDEEDYSYSPDDNISEQDQITLNKMIRERAKKGKKKLVEVED